jgi:NADH:ubiquinone oxidoreductase subunit 2 (subunit N)
VEEFHNCYSGYLTFYNLFIIFVVVTTVITSVISTFYYLRFIKIMWFKPVKGFLRSERVKNV